MMEIKPRITVVYLPGLPDIGRVSQFHINQRITNSLYSEMFGRPDTTLNRGEAVTAEIQQLALSLHNVDGIINVDVDQFCVTVHIDFAFDWEDVEESVLSVINDYLGWTDEDVELRHDTRYRFG